MSHDETTAVGRRFGDGDLLDAVNNLSDRVEGLTESLSINEHQTRRVRVLTLLVILLLTIGVVVGFHNTQSIKAQVEANHGTQVQQCENANSVRTANITLWTTIITLSSSGPGKTTSEKQMLDALLVWIEQLYQPRDCADLGRVYKVPAPPDFAKMVSGNRA